MADTNDLALWYALNRLITNYWADVDDNGGSQAHEFYLADALYAVGNNRFEGQEKIRVFYERRRQRGNTTTRHLIANLRVFRDDARHSKWKYKSTRGPADVLDRTSVRGFDFPAGNRRRALQIPSILERGERNARKVMQARPAADWQRPNSWLL